MEKTKEKTGREKSRAFLKRRGKDPDKFLKEEKPPESSSAGAAPSAETQKALEDQAKEKERQGTESRAKAEEAKKAEAKRLLDTKDSDLNDEEKKKKKDLVILQETEREAERESRIQKRIDDLSGQTKALKDERSQDKSKISTMEKEIELLKGTSTKKAEEVRQEAIRKETERLKKYEESDQALPVAERREMSKADLENWLIEDIAEANVWIARRELRRDRERTADIEGLSKSSSDAAARSNAEDIIRKQDESQARVKAKYPDLDYDKLRARGNELKKEGKTEPEIKQILETEFKRAHIAAQALKENQDKYALDPDGPEKLAEEVEKRMNTESVEDRDARIAAEAVEAEKQRAANVDSTNRSTQRGGGPKDEGDPIEKDPTFGQQLDIWKQHFPHETEEVVKARLIRRLKHRRTIGA